MDNADYREQTIHHLPLMVGPVDLEAHVQTWHGRYHGSAVKDAHYHQYAHLDGPDINWEGRKHDHLVPDDTDGVL